MRSELSVETCLARTSSDIFALRVQDQGDATQPLSEARRTGKAFVVYEMSRHVYVQVAVSLRSPAVPPFACLSDGTISYDDACTTGLATP